MPGEIGLALAGWGPTIIRNNQYAGVSYIMNMVLVVLILLLLVAGTVGLIIGRKNINVGTLVGTWLTLLSAVGFIYLSGRVAERERVWRSKVRQLRADLETTVSGPLASKRLTFAKLPDDADEAEQKARLYLSERIEKVGGFVTDEITRDLDYFVVANASENIPDKAKKFELESLDQASLEKLIDSSLDRITSIISDERRKQFDIETWRNRYWRSTFFKPPQISASSGKPGLYDVTRSAVVELPLAGSGGNPPINKGAELAIFNLNADDEEGFLGLFSVSNVSAADGKILEVTIDPLTTPDEYDRRAWDRWSLVMRASSKPELVVFEDLPSAGESALDSLTVLRGIKFDSDDDPATRDFLTGLQFSSRGIEGLRQDILIEMKTVARDNDRISQALEATTREKDRAQATARSLIEDRDAWQEDVSFAGTALEKLTERTGRVQADLKKTRQEISSLRTELETKTSLFLTEMSRRMPPTGSGGPSLP